MKFARIENAIQVCKKHLTDAAGASNIAEIDTFLAGYLLAIIYAEYEAKIKQILNARSSRSGGDDLVQNHSRYYIGRRTGRIGISDLAEALTRFGDRCGKQFKAEVEKQGFRVPWDNIMTNRHALAHLSGTQITFAEVTSFYHQSHGVFSVFGRALDLSAAEMGKL